MGVGGIKALRGADQQRRPGQALDLRRLERRAADRAQPSRAADAQAGRLDCALWVDEDRPQRAVRGPPSRPEGRDAARRGHGVVVEEQRPIPARRLGRPQAGVGRPREARGAGRPDDREAGPGARAAALGGVIHQNDVLIINGGEREAEEVGPPVVGDHDHGRGGAHSAPLTRASAAVAAAPA